jgi:hypothetical protein
VETRDDLFHDVLTKLNDNESFKNMNDKEKTYFFVGVIRRQVYSVSSPYYRTYKRFKNVEINDGDEVIDIPYQEVPTMEWLRETMEQELKNNPNFWYNKMLYETYIDNKGFIERVHKRTQIPRYAIKETIQQMNEWFKLKWNEYKDNNYE